MSSPLTLIQVASLQNKANFPFHQVCLLTGFWAAAAGPTFSSFWSPCEAGLSRDLAQLSRDLAPVFFPRRATAMTVPGCCNEAAVHGYWPQVGFGEMFLAAAKIISFGDPSWFSCSTASNFSFPSVEQKDTWMSWRVPRPSKFMGVHPTNFSFEHQVVFGLFGNWF